MFSFHFPCSSNPLLDSSNVSFLHLFNRWLSAIFLQLYTFGFPLLIYQATNNLRKYSNFPLLPPPTYSPGERYISGNPFRVWERGRNIYWGVSILLSVAVSSFPTTPTFNPRNHHTPVGIPPLPARYYCPNLSRKSWQRSKKSCSCRQCSHLLFLSSIMHIFYVKSKSSWLLVKRCISEPFPFPLPDWVLQLFFLSNQNNFR